MVAFFMGRLWVTAAGYTQNTSSKWSQRVIHETLVLSCRLSHGLALSDRSWLQIHKIEAEILR